MQFTANEIQLARRLKERGLHWTPSVGHYVWDEADIIRCPSPFHDRVFFILDLKHFLRRADTIEQLQRDLCWLPTWYDARQILRHYGVTDAAVQHRLAETQAIEKSRERLCLYQMIENTLAVTHASMSATDLPKSRRPQNRQNR